MKCSNMWVCLFIVAILLIKIVDISAAHADVDGGLAIHKDKSVASIDKTQSRPLDRLSLVGIDRIKKAESISIVEFQPRAKAGVKGGSVDADGQKILLRMGGWSSSRENPNILSCWVDGRFTVLKAIRGNEPATVTTGFRIHGIEHPIPAMITQYSSFTLSDDPQAPLAYAFAHRDTPLILEKVRKPHDLWPEKYLYIVYTSGNAINYKDSGFIGPFLPEHSDDLTWAVKELLEMPNENNKSETSLGLLRGEFNSEAQWGSE